ncbi:MAG: hypothetical protein ACTIM4_11880 [Marinomonas sp.]
MTQIQDSVVDDITHQACSVLEAYGTKFTVNDKYELSDIIAEFLRSTLGVEVVESEPKLDSDYLEISFDTSQSRTTQNIFLINENYSPEDIKTGLESETLKTTLDHSLNEPAFIEVSKTGERIALIQSQTTKGAFASYE